ncbi:MAG: DUF2339 domain-containing protein [Planctomycetaceae bacterium]|nr:DUF2339 domain-containing protein [Planctomycetaceae bacterium]
MEFIIFPIFGTLLALFFLFSGPIALIWLLGNRNQINELKEQVYKLELRELKQNEKIVRLEMALRQPEGETADGRQQTAGVRVNREGVNREECKPETVVERNVMKADETADNVRQVKHLTEDNRRQVLQQTADSRRRLATMAESLFKVDIPIPPTQSPAPCESKQEPTTVSADITPVTSQSLELFIGRKLFGWIAAVGFIVAAALFIRYAINEGWITDTLKVGGVAVFGFILLGIGYYSHRTGLRRFSTMMSAAGIIVVFQAGYASYAIYRLVSFDTGNILMPLIVLGGFLLAWFYRSKLLGTVTIVGGLAVPILVSTGEDDYQKLFIYLTALNIGTLVLVNLLRRAPIAFIAFFGTQALFWMWFNEYCPSPNIELHTFNKVLFFQSAFYFVYLTDTIIAAWRPIGKKLKPTWDDAMRAVLAPIIFFGTIFILSKLLIDKAIFEGDVVVRCFQVSNPLQDNLGIFAFIGAAWYTLLAICYSRHLRVPSDDTVVGSRYWQAAPSAAVVIALGFVAIGIPLQFDAMWITLGWLTVFAGLWYFGHRQNDQTFLVMSVVFFGLGIVRFVSEITDQLNTVRNLLDITPVCNTTALPMLACAGMLTVAAVLTSRYVRDFVLHKGTKAQSRESHDAFVLPCKTNENTVANYFFGILGYVLLGIILSGEAARYLYATPEIWEPYQPAYLLPAFLLGFGFILAVFLLQVGFVFRSRVITAAALCGLAFAVLSMPYGFDQRREYEVPFNNPFSFVLIVQSVILLLIGFQSKFVNCHSREGGNLDDKLCSLDPRLREGDVRCGGEGFGEKEIITAFQFIFGGFGVVGLFSLLAILTVEWHFGAKVLTTLSLAACSITLLWSVYALLWLTLGFAIRNLPIRVCGLIILFVTLMKTTFMDSFESWRWGIANGILLTNGYFFIMLFPVIPALALAVWTNRGKLSFIGEEERSTWKAAGILGLASLLIYLSIECYQYFDTMERHIIAMEYQFLGAAALTVFWTFAALILTTLALCFQSKTLRIISMLLLWWAVMGVLAGMDNRPGFTTPFLNLYFAPTLFLSGVLLAMGCLWLYRLPKDSKERKVYRFLAFCAVGFLWLTTSVECFRSLQLWQGADSEAWKAHMALSILWSLFAGVLIAIGFIWRSATLRWMAILLFAATLTKILFVDMSGVNELYRFGAVFALALLLALAGRAYQRFKPE